MKVAILNNLFPPNSHGGAEEAAKTQTNTFFVQGNEVIVLTLSLLNKKSVQSRDGIKIYELRHRNIFNYFNIGRHSAPVRFLWHIIDTFNFWLANDIGKILKQEKPDLVITHNLKGLSFLTPLKSKNLKIKNYQVMHDVQLYTPSGLIEYGKENIFEHTGLPTRIYRFFTRRLFKYADKVFFPSAWLLNFYRKNDFFINQEKILEPNEAGFKGGPSTSSGTNNYCLSEVEGVQQRSGFLYVGQLEPHKGVILLFDAFEKLNELVPERSSSKLFPERSEAACPAKLIERSGESRGDIKLHIIGDGSLMPEIKKRAQLNPNIIVHGRVPREKLPEFYSRAKATIFPSLVYENAPMVIAESLSCGTPVICSRLGGAPELIREGENGITFTPGDANDLAEKIKKFL